MGFFSKFGSIFTLCLRNFLKLFGKQCHVIFQRFLIRRIISLFFFTIFKAMTFFLGLGKVSYLVHRFLELGFSKVVQGSPAICDYWLEPGVACCQMNSWIVHTFFLLPFSFNLYLSWKILSLCFFSSLKWYQKLCLNLWQLVCSFQMILRCFCYIQGYVFHNIGVLKTCYLEKLVIEH